MPRGKKEQAKGRCLTYRSYHWHRVAPLGEFGEDAVFGLAKNEADSGSISSMANRQSGPDPT